MIRSYCDDDDDDDDDDEDDEDDDAEDEDAAVLCKVAEVAEVAEAEVAAVDGPLVAVAVAVAVAVNHSLRSSLFCGAISSTRCFVCRFDDSRSIAIALLIAVLVSSSHPLG